MAMMQGGRLEIGKNVKIRHPVVFLGRGLLVLEDGVTLGYPKATKSKRPIMLQPRNSEAEIIIGARTTIVNGVEIIATKSIRIGKECLIGARCVIIDSDFHRVCPEERRLPAQSAPVTIGDNVWLGLEALILKGVTIGDGAVIGARALVKRDVPSRALVVAPEAIEVSGG